MRRQSALLRTLDLNGSVRRGVSLFGMLLVGGASLGALTAPVAAADDCNHTIFDGGGYIYDFESSPANVGGIPPDLKDEYGAPYNGGSHDLAGTPPGPATTNDAWDDWGDVFVYGQGADLVNPVVGDKYDGPNNCQLGIGGQEIAYPVVSMHGLDVQHRWYVDPGSQHGGRILTVLRNPGSSPLTVTVVQGDPSGYDDLGSDSSTAARATSDGTGAFSSASTWGVTSDGSSTDGDPALAHVWDGVGGAIHANEVVLGTTTGTSPGKDVLYWDWPNVTVQPGATAAFISYEIQDVTASRATATEVAEASAQARGRETQPASSLYVGMSPAEIAGTLNWPRPAATAKIAPVKHANAAVPVKLNGVPSIAAVGLPQCAIASYAWSADGAKGKGSTFRHSFSPGKHSAKLTVTSNCGGTSTTTAHFHVAKAFSFLKLKQEGPGALLVVKTLGPGKLKLAGKGVKKEVSKVKHAGKAQLTVEATGKALEQLRQTGATKLKVKVTFKPRRGKASHQTKTVKLTLH